MRGACDALRPAPNGLPATPQLHPLPGCALASLECAARHERAKRAANATPPRAAGIGRLISEGYSAYSLLGVVGYGMAKAGLACSRSTCSPSAVFIRWYSMYCARRIGVSCSNLQRRPTDVRIGAAFAARSARSCRGARAGRTGAARPAPSPTPWSFRYSANKPSGNRSIAFSCRTQPRKQRLGSGS